MQTTLYHACVPGGPTDVSFQLGASTFFAPVDEDALYRVEPQLAALASWKERAA